MNVKNMNELIVKLLDKKIIEVLSNVAFCDDIEWFDEKFEQYIVTDCDYMVTFCNDDGYITDIEGFSKDLKNNWFGITFDGAMIDLEFIDVDGQEYSNLCDVNVWRKELM